MQEKFNDNNEVIRRRKVKKTDNTMAEEKKDKRRNIDVQNTTQETKDRATRRLLKIESVSPIVSYKSLFLCILTSYCK